MEASLEAGVSEKDFWEQTPYLTKKILKAATEKMRKEYQFGMWQAYAHVSLFREGVGVFGSKAKLRSLHHYMAPLMGPDYKRPTKSPEELLNMATQFNAVLGGKDTRH